MCLAPARISNPTVAASWPAPRILHVPPCLAVRKAVAGTKAVPRKPLAEMGNINATAATPAAAAAATGAAATGGIHAALCLTRFSKLFLNILANNLDQSRAESLIDLRSRISGAGPV